ncbi:hypothetical protein OGH69_07050 [Flavobacterium sp. MFBS3-15]|uniref:DUF5004 domain-containing protein n=1 Tax=Flavobacterium sp. MFBS3-15 TaxID=2989816 RepID=UPI0022369397|nr:hypothetical protein [Flavobacterium sp. MFBS3-15]MCW4468712.1 hypothetical protein [Flavobacterium sp. MFBS3-15]
MKKMTMVAFAATALLALSCSSDDNDTTTSAVAGKWKLTSVTTNEPFDGNGDGTESTDLLTEAGNCLPDSYLEFGSDGSFTSFMNVAPEEGATCEATTKEGSYELEYLSVKTEVEIEGETERITYQKSGNLLRINIPEFYQAEIDGNPVKLNAKMIFTKQ